MAGRFLSTPFYASVLGLSFLAKKHTTSLKLLTLFTTLIPLIAYKSIYPNFIAGERYKNSKFISGIADERGYYFQATGLIKIINSKSRQRSRRFVPKINKWNKPDKEKYPALTWMGCGGLGLKGLTKGPGAHMIDLCALTDPLLARLPMPNKSWRIGHFRRQLPTGYEQYIKNKISNIAEPLAVALNKDIDIAIRGNLWSWKRVPAILNLLFNNNTQLKTAYRNTTIQPYLEVDDIVEYKNFNKENLAGKRWDAPGSQRIYYALILSLIHI